MWTISLPVLAGTVSTVVFAASTLPMLVKAYRSRDLRSYSLGYEIQAAADVLDAPARTQQDLEGRGAQV